MPLTDLRTSIRAQIHADEHEVVTNIIAEPALDKAQRQTAIEDAKDWVEASRKDKSGQSALDSFLLEFGLSNKEGVALMCLAESLLRVPDKTSADRLIAEKIRSGDWSSHLGDSDSLFVNASSFGLLLTGTIVKLDSNICQNPGNWAQQISARLGEPVIRAAFYQAMKLMGQHYVLGRSIQEGLARKFKGESENLYSFDMLGEAARTDADAQGYFESYSRAIDAIGYAQKTNSPADVYTANGISVKLSALHPRYEFAQKYRVLTELLARIKALCLQARKFNLGLSIDAEEAARLDMSLDLFEALAKDPDLKDWSGLGFVLQAYLKNSPFVADWLIALAKASNRRIMIRLVKGAYWDYEIKHAQEQGLEDYPVFTRKVHTDACYLYCAKKLLEHSEQIFPQFATHNAHTAASIFQLAKATQLTTATPREPQFELQRLHGMGDLLYKHVRANKHSNDNPPKTPLRVYAPIGKHQDLLPYLVRRLLENGANSSFVNRFLDAQTPVDALVTDHYEDILRASHHRHAQIPLPRDIYIHQGEPRANSRGVDLDSEPETTGLIQDMAKGLSNNTDAACLIDGEVSGVQRTPIFSPQDCSFPIAHARHVNDELIENAISLASGSARVWSTSDVKFRADILRTMANLLEENRTELISLITKEGGRTIPDGVSEVREAIDFCRYYALQAESLFKQDNDIRGCGVFLCISPWNFPLAIFVGQIAAALVAGNSVVAKPAEPTQKIAMRATELFHEAGIPSSVLHLLLGSGRKIGDSLLSDSRLSGVCFTGSTEVAKSINQQLANRTGSPVPLIAETGGQNCLIADSTALPEQLVDDIIASAFQSAGQRCSALRVLFIQEEIADKTLEMLKGAMQSLVVGDPKELSTDIGPVIDMAAKHTLERHAQKMNLVCKQRYEFLLGKTHSTGTFFAPRFYEIDSLDQLEQEVFGPILHVIRYRSDALDDVIRQINATGYGLTLGVHSRIESFADHVIRHTAVGNNYINRNMVGAVVGVNPFGGMGLSGTGPKAGGPNYLHRFCRFESEPLPASIDVSQANLLKPTATFSPVFERSSRAFDHIQNIGPANTLNNLFEDERLWAEFQIDPSSLAPFISNRIGNDLVLPSPTGEENRLTQDGRGVVCSLAMGNSIQNALELAFLSMGTGCSTVLFCMPSIVEEINRFAKACERHGLPIGIVQALPAAAMNQCLAYCRCDAALVQHGQDHTKAKMALASRADALVSLTELPTSLGNLSPEAIQIIQTNLMVEKTRTENLVARGGNTALFCIQDTI